MTLDPEQVEKERGCRHREWRCRCRLAIRDQQPDSQQVTRRTAPTGKPDILRTAPVGRPRLLHVHYCPDRTGGRRRRDIDPDFTEGGMATRWPAGGTRARPRPDGSVPLDKSPLSAWSRSEITQSSVQLVQAAGRRTRPRARLSAKYRRTAVRAMFNERFGELARGRREALGAGRRRVVDAHRRYLSLSARVPEGGVSLAAGHRRRSQTGPRVRLQSIGARSRSARLRPSRASTRDKTESASFACISYFQRFICTRHRYYIGSSNILPAPP